MKEELKEKLIKALASAMGISSLDKGKMKASWGIRKWHGEKVGNPYEERRWDFNLLLNEGINELFTVLCSSSGIKFDATNAYLGVGDSNAAESASQTGLQATTNKLYKPMDTGFPTFGTSQMAVWRATFGGSEANFAWEEFTVANGSSDASVNLNRKVTAKGTKQAGDTWELTLQISLS